jgi:hypothetical protein
MTKLKLWSATHICDFAEILCALYSIHALQVLKKSTDPLSAVQLWQTQQAQDKQRGAWWHYEVIHWKRKSLPYSQDRPYSNDWRYRILTLESCALLGIASSIRYELYTCACIIVDMTNTVKRSITPLNRNGPCLMATLDYKRLSLLWQRWRASSNSNPQSEHKTADNEPEILLSFLP